MPADYASDARWVRLFDDLEGQARGADENELLNEVADRIRRERLSLGLHERFAAHRGAVLDLRLLCDYSVRGRVVDAGAGWVLLDDDGRVSLVAVAAVRGVGGLTRRVTEPGAVARRFGLALAVQAICRDRASVDVVDITGSVLTGTIEEVGKDSFELALHGADEARRAGNVRNVWSVLFAAVAMIRRR